MSNVQTRQRNTELTAWFELNKTDLSAKDILYHDLPKYYVWKPHLRIWSRRKHSKVTNMIGRMYFINPSNIEAFSLRLILLHQSGATCFKSLRTLENKFYDSFQACAIARGLLQDDQTWNDTLNEASSVCTETTKLRLLFCII